MNTKLFCYFCLICMPRRLRLSQIEFLQWFMGSIEEGLISCLRKLVFYFQILVLKSVALHGPRMFQRRWYIWMVYKHVCIGALSGISRVFFYNAPKLKTSSLNSKPSTNMLQIYVQESVKDSLEISEEVHAGGRWTQARHIHYVPGFLSHQPPIIE